MRILFCIDSLTGGGAEKLLIRYIDILKKHIDCDITLFIISGYGVLMNCIPAHIQVFIGDDLTDEDAFLFDHQFFDLEIGFLEGRAIKFIALRNSSAIKVGWIHTDMLNNNWCQDYYKDGMQEEMYNIMDYIICINDYCARQFHYAFPNVQTKILICNNVLDFTLLDKTKKHEPNKNELNKGIIRLCFVGRLTKEKHPDIAVQAVKHLIHRGYSVYLNVLGEGYLYDELNNIIKYNKLENNVQLLGYRSEPYEIISTCDLLISISDVEGGPLNVAEAYYLGVPIISSHSGGSDDFGGSFGGLVYTEISPITLSKSIEDIFANNAQLYLQLRSQLCYEEIKEKYGEKALVSLFNNWKQKIRKVTN